MYRIRSIITAEVLYICTRIDTRGAVSEDTGFFHGNSDQSITCQFINYSEGHVFFKIDIVIFATKGITRDDRVTCEIERSCILAHIHTAAGRIRISSRIVYGVPGDLTTAHREIIVAIVVYTTALQTGCIVHDLTVFQNEIAFVTHAAAVIITSVFGDLSIFHRE